MSDLVQFPLRDIPADLKRELVRDANATGRNVNDVMVGIIAAHFGFAFVGTGRRSDSADEKKLDITLRLPRELRRRVKDRANGADVSAQDVVVRIACEHYGIRFVKRARPPRRRRRSAPSAAAA